MLHLEEGLVTVQIKSVNQTVAVPFDEIFPLEDDDDDDDCDIDDYAGQVTLLILCLQVTSSGNVILKILNLKRPTGVLRCD